MKRKLNINTANIQNEHELKNKTGGFIETLFIRKYKVKPPQKRCPWATSLTHATIAAI